MSSFNSDDVSKDLVRLQGDLEDQRKRLAAMQSQINRFIRGREENLRTHAAKKPSATQKTAAPMTQNPKASPVDPKAG